MSAVPTFGQTSASGQRRGYMTVMFVDLCGSTALSDTLDAEIYGEILQRLRALGREIIARHGGLIVRVQGDGILVLFGQPEAREDDGRRAVEAALQQVSMCALPFEWRVA